jgi:hypothetical protein
MKKIYIAGPMRGYPGLNWPAFDSAAKRARKMGYEVVNPAEMDREIGIDPNSTFTDAQVEEMLKRDFQAIDQCDAIALLCGWSHSKGALREIEYALSRKKMILHESDFLPYSPAHSRPLDEAMYPPPRRRIKDSGKRHEFESGMVRDVQDDKTLYDLIYDGPMFERWATHLTHGAKKYAARNWMKASGDAELQRFRASAFRHFIQWFRGDTDEDHAAAVFFNLNGAEYVKAKLGSNKDGLVERIAQSASAVVEEAAA